MSRRFRLSLSGLTLFALLLLGLAAPTSASGTPSTSPHWSIHAVPGDGDALSGVSCFSDTRCVGVSLGSRQVVTSVDGGVTWKVREAPRLASMGFTSLSCLTGGTCWATAVVGRTGPGGGAILRSDDAGVRWRSVRTLWAPGNATYRLNDVACTTPQRCLVSGTTGYRGFILTTMNGGRTWSQATLPAQPAAGSITGVHCGGALKCFALQGTRAQIYLSLDGGLTWKALPPPKNFTLYEGGHGTSSGLSAISCGSTDFCTVGGFIARPLLQATTEPIKWVTTDGGATWQFFSPFAETGAKSQFAISNGAISCFAGRSCELGLYYGYLYRTTDEGVSWQRDVTAPNLDSNVLSLSCTNVRHCVASVISNFPSTKLFEGSIWLYR
jgi:photosystem II stability/assembly factor-like uncharacterized protein